MEHFVSDKNEIGLLFLTEAATIVPLSSSKDSPKYQNCNQNETAIRFKDILATLSSELFYLKVEIPFFIAFLYSDIPYTVYG